MKKIVTAGVVVLLLAACSSEPMVSDYDVLVHENRGELLALYQRMNSELKEAKPSSELAENRRIYIDRVGRRIADDQERQILNALDRDPDKHDIATLQTAQQDAAQIEKYNREVYLDINGQLQRSIDNKMAAIREQEARFDALTDEQAPEKVRLLDAIALIYGGDMAQQTLARRSEYLSALYRNAELAMQSKRHEDVHMHLANLRRIDAQYPGLDQLGHLLIAAEHEQDFWDALSRGNTERAFATYRQLTRIPDYLQQNPDVVPVARQLADLFIAEGNKQMGSYSVNAAYQSFTRARYIKVTLGQQQDYSEGEKRFIDFVVRRLQAYIDEADSVPAYAFMQVLENLDPEHELVAEFGQLVNNNMLDNATIKIVPSAFSDVERRDIGSSTVDLIKRQLQDNNAIRVQLVDSAADGSRLTRSVISGMPNAGSYYFLSGEVLEAQVVSSSQHQPQQQQVLVSYQRIENPDYVAWTRLKRREKQNTPEPAATIQVPVEQDVTINKTRVEKQGVLSVSYRLAAAVSANVLFADAITREKRVEGENIEALSLGLFDQPEKTAGLPGDGQILDVLALDVASEIAGNLADQVAGLEQRYRQRADQAVVREDFNAAIANYGYANVLAQAAGEQDQELLEKLRTFAIRWRN